MIDFAKYNRATGRTSRMVFEATALALAGESVTVVAGSKAHANSLSRDLPQTVEVLSVSENPPPPSPRVLWDHYALEREFGDAIGQWLHWQER